MVILERIATAPSIEGRALNLVRRLTYILQMTRKPFLRDSFFGLLGRKKGGGAAGNGGITQSERSEGPHFPPLRWSFVEILGMYAVQLS